MGKYRVWTLASGSSGNAVFFESEDDAILVDAGISGKAIEGAIKKVGGDSSKIRGIVLTHSHSDHSKSAGVIARRYSVPIYTTKATYEHCLKRLGSNFEYRLFKTSEDIKIAGFTLNTIPTPHDAIDSVALVVEHDGVRCGVLTDLGHVFYKLEKEISNLDAVILESNYDPEMLTNGAYPYHLKQRISSKAGHISNEEAAYLLLNSQGERLKTVMLAHLSNENNSPEKALKCHVDVLAKSRKNFKLMVAPRSEPSDVISFT